MIALDTNILVYAVHAESPNHAGAERILRDLTEGETPWCLPWPCAYEFLRVVTHPRVFARPLPIRDALEVLEAVLDSPSIVLIGPGPNHRLHLRRTVLEGGVRGNLVHDAHLAALLVENGVTEIWSADRDFSRFPSVWARNPFSAAH